MRSANEGSESSNTGHRVATSTYPAPPFAFVQVMQSLPLPLLGLARSCARHCERLQARRNNARKGISNPRARLPHLVITFLASSNRWTDTQLPEHRAPRPSSVNIAAINASLSHSQRRAVKELIKLNSRARVTVLRTRMNTGSAGRFDS